MSDADFMKTQIFHPVIMREVYPVILREVWLPF